MNRPNQAIEVIDCQAGENVYMHKDFHHIMAFVIKYIDENFGPEKTEEFLRRVGVTVFSPLIAKLKEQGLSALEKHWRDVFTKEEGRFELNYENERLILNVDQCPATAFLHAHGLQDTKRFCLSTTIVNKAICQAAGYQCDCQYDSDKGQCIQKFWKEKP